MLSWLNNHPFCKYLPSPEIKNKDFFFIAKVLTCSYYCYSAVFLWASLVAQIVKNLLGKCKTGVRSLDWKDPLEKGMATHSIILAWRIPWTEEPCGL